MSEEMLNDDNMSFTIPVYFINGFLESGKTTFIRDTIVADFFRIDELTVIIACEEGEVEYDRDNLAYGDAVLVTVEDKTELTLKFFRELEEKYDPGRIIIEYNGMWDPNNLLLPTTWHMEEQITLLDATTFAVYFANMKSKVGDMVRNADVIVFNRCDGLLEQLPGWRRSIRAINQFGDIVFEDANGEIDDLDMEDLPYNLEDDFIELNDQTYGVWYLDVMEHPSRYVGKTFKFLAMAMHGEEYPEGWFIPGRIAMVCCEEDVAFLGYPCRWDGEKNTPDQTWITVTARLERQEWFEYEGSGPVLYPEKIEPAEQPESIMIGIG